MSTSKTDVRRENVLRFEEAHQLVLGHAATIRPDRDKVEQLPLLEALGRTLSEDLLADRDFPPFPRATRDGYAVLSEDLQGASASLPVQLSVVAELRAGGSLPAGFTQVHRGEAVSIMTGAPVPAGADAVVMIEYATRHTNLARVACSVHSGENVVARGSEAGAGSVLVPAGTILGHRQIALAAAVGKSSIKVFARPNIAILPTGDEIVPIEVSPANNQIRNSNSYSLAAQVISAGGEPIQLPIAPDEPKRLRELIERGLENDLLLLSGGVSAGEYDLVEDALSSFAAEFLFTGVQMQPGKPLVFGRIPRTGRASSHCYFFGLPGNPISTMVTFKLFAEPMLRALSGATPDRMRTTKAKLSGALKVKTGLTRFLPAQLSGAWNDPEVETVSWQGSGDIAAFAQADCLLVVPADREQFEAGEMMTVVQIS